MDTENSKPRLGHEIIGYVSFLLAVVAFSGIFANAEGPLRILDFQTFVGSFGVIAEGASAGILGRGGFGVKEGFFQALNMAPNMVLSVAFLALVERYGGFEAAQKLLTPLLKPFAGIPGVTAPALISNWQSSDASAVIARTLMDEGRITGGQRDILVAYEFVAAATIGVFFSIGSMLFPYLTVSAGSILLLIMAMKFVAANMMRLYLFVFERGKSPPPEAGEACA